MTMFQSAFVDAGLMSAWYASFNNGPDHRVMEVTYNAAKAYGKTYYWFSFDGTNFAVQCAVGWNGTSNIPRGIGGATGTQFLDWVANTTNTLPTGSHTLVTSLSSSVSVSLTRYTSSGRSFFLLRASTANYACFTIDPSSVSFRSWVDLDFHMHCGFFRTSTSSLREASFLQAVRTRRDALTGGYLNQSGSINAYNSAVATNRYMFGNNTPVAGYTTQGMPLDRGFLLPNWSPFSNPQAPSTYNPVFTGLRISAAHATDLPADFGVAVIKVSNTITIQDNATVTAGTEEYEVLDATNAGTTSGTMAANPAFLARIVG
jgi:hypothetical protein